MVCKGTAESLSIPKMMPSLVQGIAQMRIVWASRPSQLYLQLQGSLEDTFN